MANNVDRDGDIFDTYQKGVTRGQLSVQHGVSESRVGQIVRAYAKKHGLTLRAGARGRNQAAQLGGESVEPAKPLKAPFSYFGGKSAVVKSHDGVTLLAGSESAAEAPAVPS